MRKYYHSKASALRFAALYIKLGVVSAALGLMGFVFIFLAAVALHIPPNCFISGAAVGMAAFKLGVVGLSLAGLATLTACLVYLKMPDTARIRQIITRLLCDPAYGNPLHLREGVFLPSVICREVDTGVYDLTITVVSVSVEEILNIQSRISTALNKKFQRYAVTAMTATPDFHSVIYRLEDVMSDKSIAYDKVEQMRPQSPYLLAVQRGANIDLTTSGSMLVAGKTRSGKTTGVISLLLQILLQGRDEFGSEVLIIDPKQAELSRLPHTVTLDENGEARTILEALRRFEANIKERQKVLNDFSEDCGNAVLWWQASFKPSVLFIDEYVACRSVFPKKAAKDGDYCLAEFDALVKRIVTMGASAGCYVIISIAQASVDEGGLPSMLRSAMSTRILFKPTLDEGRLIWPGSSLEALSSSRVYNAGDAWFSSTDGEHDTVSYVHFPHMKFPVYRELRRLLGEYYAD